MPGHTQKYELSSIEEAYAHTSPRNVLKMKEIEFAQPNNLKLGCQSDSTSDETDDDTISYLDEEKYVYVTLVASLLLHSVHQL